MDSLATLSRHRRVARVLLLIFVGVVVFLRWLVSSLLGLFVLALLGYAFAGAIFEITPLRPAEVIAWGAAQEPQVILAEAGIFGAYWIATRTWKEQKRLEIQLDAATHILTFFESARSDALKLQLFADRLNTLQANLMGSATRSLAQGQALLVLQQIPEIIAARMRLAAQASQVHDLRSRYELILSRGFFTSLTFDVSQKALDEITSAMWFPIPLSATGVFELQAELSKSDARQWAHFVRVASRAQPKMAAAAGGLTGLIHGRLFGPTFASVFRLTKTSRVFMADRGADA